MFVKEVNKNQSHHLMINDFTLQIFFLKMGMFSYICKKCGRTEQFNHYPLATIKLIEKYLDGVIENIERTKYLS